MSKLNEAGEGASGRADTAPISRRKLLAALGATGAALASQALLARTVGGTAHAEGIAVTEAVYGVEPRREEPKPSVHIGWYNVRSYGASGNGADDDGAALERLLQIIGDSEAELYFPKGSYRIRANLTFPDTVRLRFDRGAVLAPDAGAAVTVEAGLDAPLSQIFGGEGAIEGGFGGVEVYPQWWGAKGDGIADDTAAVRQALRLAKAGGGVHVRLIGGVYKLTDMLHLYRRTKLEMDHNAVLKRCHDGSFFLNGDYGDQYDGYDGHGHISIEGGLLEGNVVDYPDAFVGINIAHARDVTIRDLTVKDISWAHAIEINASRDVTIERCRFVGFKNAADGSRYYAEAVQIDVPTPTAFTYFGKYDGTPCRSVTVRDCYFGPSGTPGTTAWGAGVGTHTAIHDVWTDNLKIVDNTFEGLLYWAVRLMKYNDCLVQGNTMLGCGGGVTVSTPGANSGSTKDKDGVQHGTPQAGTRLLIRDNFIVGTTKYEGIGCFGSGDVRVKGVSIAGNFVVGVTPDKSAVSVTRTESFDVTGNTIGQTRRGIYAENIADGRLDGNDIEEAEYEGIWIAKGARMTVCGNRIRRTVRTGLLLTGIDGFAVEGNAIDASGLAGLSQYGGIKLDAGTMNGSVRHNTVRSAPGTANRYGLEVTSACGGVHTFDNALSGAAGAYFNGSADSSDHLRLYSPNGTRFRLSVNDAGELAASPSP